MVEEESEVILGVVIVMVMVFVGVDVVDRGREIARGRVVVRERSRERGRESGGPKEREAARVMGRRRG